MNTTVAYPAGVALVLVRVLVLVLVLASALALGIAGDASAACIRCHADVALSAAHSALIAKHTSKVLTCTDCHRGDEKAEKADDAHVAAGLDELLRKERVQAACARCHVPGAVEGMDFLVAGTKLYLELGCQTCHVASAKFGSLAAFAPPLASIGARGSKYLEQVVRKPAEIFKATVMPSYDRELDRDPARAKGLIAFLMSMTGETTRANLPESATKACVSCHTSPAKPTGAKHRCRLIHDDRVELSCKRCHAKTVPARQTECLYIAQRRRDCGVCHQGGVDGQ